MTDRQIEELAKLFLDLGKLVFASLVIGFFQSKSDPLVVIVVALFGLTFSAGLFILGLKLFKEVK